MTEARSSLGNGCCGTTESSCVFTKALLARSAVCECSRRRSVGERDVVECNSPTAMLNCTTLAALLHERARFALHLPRPGQPLMHAKAMRLHCGGIQALQDALHDRGASGAAPADIHQLVGAAQQRFGSLTELPWQSIVDGLVQWQPRRPRRAAAP
jgi:hypothetical protein